LPLETIVFFLLDRNSIVEYIETNKSNLFLYFKITHIKNLKLFQKIKGFISTPATEDIKNYAEHLEIEDLKDDDDLGSVMAWPVRDINKKRRIQGKEQYLVEWDSVNGKKWRDEWVNGTCVSAKTQTKIRDGVTRKTSIHVSLFPTKQLKNNK